jgi:hypothetical protein
MSNENTRTATQAQIKRASELARENMDALDAQVLDELTRLYQRAASDIQSAIRSYADSKGSLRLEVMRDLLRQVAERLAQLESARNTLLNAGLTSAALIGGTPMAGVGASLTQISDDAVRFVRAFVAADGLQLSDRLWRLDQGAREAVARAIQSAVVQGYSASQAVNEFLINGAAAPADLLDKIGAANAQRMAAKVGEALLTGDGNARANALRVFRTELNRAHGEAYAASADQVPGFAGFKYLLSPGHPRPDICDLHASANLYGLGAGVYPDRQRLPWPAHPNTLSYFDVVFVEEISAADRQNVETRTEWLRRQPAAKQADVLGGIDKQRAFVQGHLNENEFTAPWRVVEQRLNNLGIAL